MSDLEQQEPENWRARLRKLGKTAFLREEMLRLGFWPPKSDEARQYAETLAALKAGYAELEPLREALAKLDREIAEVEDLTPILAEIRKRRIERVRAQREARREARMRQEAERRKQDRERRRRTPPFLGRGVSGGLRYEGGDARRLAEAGLPLVTDAAELAAAIGIEERELLWLTYHRGAATIDHYHRFAIPKRNGGQRVISSPKRRLRVAQRWLLNEVLARLEPHPAAAAFRPGASIAENAARHAGRGLVIRIDLKEFFPSIGFRRVKGLFESFGYNEGVATLLALLATEAPRAALTLDGQRHFVALGERQLPQGACTSPALTNLLCRKLDRRLTGAAASLGFTYSRYADDLVFSHEKPAAPAGLLLTLARRIVAEEGFTVHEEKTRVMRPHQRQSVTGLVVNAGSAGVAVSEPPTHPHTHTPTHPHTAPRLSRDDLRRFRAFLHHCETEGLAAVSERLGRSALAHARGYLAFVQMVSPEQAERFRARHRWLSTNGGEIQQ